MAITHADPANNVTVASLPSHTRANRIVKQREHVVYGGTIATPTGGEHTQGSARCFFQDAEPTTRISGDAFTNADLGSLWFDTNSTIDNQFNVMTSQTGGTPTWTPVSTEIMAVLLAANRIFLGTLRVTGNFDVNTNKFTVAAATGNTVVAGTLTSTGVATIADTSALATSGAPAADAQIANKKYVDDQITAGADPAYTGGESHTFDGGLILKHGITGNVGNDASATVTFGDAFPGGIISASVSPLKVSGDQNEAWAMTTVDYTQIIEKEDNVNPEAELSCSSGGCEI